MTGGEHALLRRFLPRPAAWDPSSVVAASHAAFRRPIFPLPVAEPSLVKARDMPHGAVRFLTASPGGMRCRPYNYGEAAAKANVVIPSETLSCHSEP